MFEVIDDQRNRAASACSAIASAAPAPATAAGTNVESRTGETNTAPSVWSAARSRAAPPEPVFGAAGTGDVTSEASGCRASASGRASRASQPMALAWEPSVACQWAGDVVERGWVGRWAMDAHPRTAQMAAIIQPQHPLSSPRLAKATLVCRTFIMEPTAAAAGPTTQEIVRCQPTPCT